MNLILGTANFCRDYGKRLERDECFQILDRAKELGIKTVATAFDYGDSIADEYGWEDRIYKWDKTQKLTWRGFPGLSMDEPFFADTELRDNFIMAPFNPLNLSFKPYCSHPRFIARSIFCGGKLQRSNPEDIAKLCLGFLKSNEVKNAVFGVESIEELELVVRVANES